MGVSSGPGAADAATSRVIEASDSPIIEALEAIEEALAGAGLAPGAVGIIASATFTPAAAAYGAGDVMDVAKTFTFTFAASGDPVPQGALIRILTAITKIGVGTIPSGQTSFTLQVYEAAEAVPLADNDPYTLAVADLSNYRGAIPLGTPVDLGAAQYIKAPYVDLDIKLPAAVTAALVARLVTDGAHTATADARTILLYGIVL